MREFCGIQLCIVLHCCANRATGIGFVGMKAVKPADILNQCAFPGDRQGQKQGVEPRVVKPFSNVTSGCENKPLLCIGDGREPVQIITPSFCTSASLQDD